MEGLSIPNYLFTPTKPTQLRMTNLAKSCLSYPRFSIYSSWLHVSFDL